MTHLTLAEEGIDSLFGTHDQNLKRLEKAFGVRLSARGADLHIEGPEEGARTVEGLMRELSILAQSGLRFRQEDIRTAIRVVQQAPEMSL
ncbi:MAG: hypothetical protein MI919_28745, partial [Holophagales bacterium]|nr:hypothetical protein [Holophagales bacterium]